MNLARSNACSYDAQQRCLLVINEHFPQAQISLPLNQGGCSFTFFVSPHGAESTQIRVIQFREKSFSLDLDIVIEAARVYEQYAPLTRQLEFPDSSTYSGNIAQMLCYEMEFIPGAPCSVMTPSGPLLTTAEIARQKKLVEDFAKFISLGWQRDMDIRRTCSGKVGSQISQKLHSLSTGLPYPHLREAARRASEHQDILWHLPVSLNHGDIIPSNIMVDPESGDLSGLVDWAEAEYLPFGTCLYGLEHLLGRISDSSKRGSFVEHRQFIYYDCAEELRRHFWQVLQSEIPALVTDKRLLDAVLLAKTVGTLLWYGYAWDDGAINRVVNCVDDVEELIYLDAFISKQV